MPDANVNELRVSEYNAALEVTQSLENRNDFQYKGVHKLVTIAGEWTDKYLSSRILPGIPQFARELSLEPARVEQFLKELSTNYNPPLVKKICLLETLGDSDSTEEKLEFALKPIRVFARPTQSEGSSCHRYVDGVNEGNVKALRSWIKERRIYPGKEKMQKNILARIKEGKLHATYASFEIGSLFQDSFDVNQTLKDATINTQLKPLLKKLVDEKLLYYFRNEGARLPGSRSVFYYNNREEILERAEIYKEYMLENIIPELERMGVMPSLSEEEMSQTKLVAEKVLSFLTDAYGDQKTLVQELYQISHIEEEERIRKEQEEKKKNLEEVLEFTKGANRLVDLDSVRVKGEPLTEELRQMVQQNEQVIYKEYADKRKLYPYVLHKEAVSGAVHNAKATFQSTGNDSEIRVLSLMNVEDYIEDLDLKKEFAKAEEKSLFKQLPFFTRLWRSIFGNIRVHRFEASEIKSKQRVEQDKLLMEQRKEKIKSESRKIAEERVKKTQTKKPERSHSSDESESIPSAGGTASSEPQLEPSEKELMNSILTTLDAAWERNIYPDRQYLLNAMDTNKSEGEVLQFLKNKGKHELFSFYIRNQGEDYKFPVLISKRYLKKNGRNLLQKAKSQVDEQKNASMPDQYKFDIAISLEDFLNRTLPKIAK